MTTTTAKQANRGHLVRAAKKGQLFVKCSFHYTDDYAFDNASGFGKMDEFKQVYLRQAHNSPLEAQINEMWNAGSAAADIEPFQEDLRRERFNHAGREQEKAQGKVMLTAHDFRTKSGHVHGDTTHGNFSVHSNLNYEYEIRS